MKQHSERAARAAFYLASAGKLQRLRARSMREALSELRRKRTAGGSLLRIANGEALPLGNVAHMHG